MIFLLCRAYRAEPCLYALYSSYMPSMYWLIQSITIRPIPLHQMLSFDKTLLLTQTDRPLSYGIFQIIFGCNLLLSFRLNYADIGLDSGLAPNGRQTFIWNHDGLAYWRIYPWWASISHTTIKLYVKYNELFVLRDKYHSSLLLLQPRFIEQIFRLQRGWVIAFHRHL